MNTNGASLAGLLTSADIRKPIPDDWELLVSVDTGTFMSATFTLLLPDQHAFTIEEFPNYRYVGGEAELIGLTTPEWCEWVVREYTRYRPRERRIRTAWLDPNSQFKSDLRRFGINPVPNPRGLELRVEIFREYIQNGRWFGAPWLTVLPYEIEYAKWPDQTSVGGKFVRIKQNDHTLDTVEHTLSRRPRHVSQLREKTKRRWVDAFLDQHRRRDRVSVADRHLGDQ